MTSEQITAAILIIGDEILSGRTQDINVSYIAQRLGELGIDLIEVRIVPDKEDHIGEAVNTLRERYAYVFTTGGIGATHDDITAASIAKAFNRNFVENEEALRILQDHYKERFNSIRRRMALMPEGITLIQNPVSGAPSFRIENVFVLAGMPTVMKGMFESLTPQLKCGALVFMSSVKSDVLEGNIADALAAIQNRYPMLAIGSYPFYQLPHVGTTLVLRGRDKELLTQATNEVIEMVKSFGAEPVVELPV